MAKKLLLAFAAITALTILALAATKPNHHHGANTER